MKRYRNLYPHEPHGLGGLLRWKLGFMPLAPRDLSHSFPEFVATPVAPDWSRLRDPDPDALQATWIGHASFLVQVDGLNLLFDPVFSEYCSPLPLPGTRRLHPPGIPLSELPTIDAVFISHSHYDHLDKATILSLGPEPEYWMPLGLRRWFANLGMKRTREMSWWQADAISNRCQVHFVPAQHFSARTWLDRNRSLWGGWVIVTNRFTLYFAGDTGYCPVFRDIGRRWGPMSVSILPIGCYEPRAFMKPMHINPAEAVQIHLDVASKRSVASHWGLFPMTQEPIGEPPRLLAHALQARHIPASSFPVLRIGQTVTYAAE